MALLLDICHLIGSYGHGLRKVHRLHLVSCQVRAQGQRDPLLSPYIHLALSVLYMYCTVPWAMPPKTGVGKQGEKQEMMGCKGDTIHF